MSKYFPGRMGNTTSSATAVQYIYRAETWGWQKVEKEEEVWFPRSTAYGENSCSSDLVGEREGRRAGQESKAGRSVVSVGDPLWPDPTVAKSHRDE